MCYVEKMKLGTDIQSTPGGSAGSDVCTYPYPSVPLPTTPQGYLNPCPSLEMSEGARLKSSMSRRYDNCSQYMNWRTYCYKHDFTKLIYALESQGTIIRESNYVEMYGQIGHRKHREWAGKIT